MCIVVVCVCKRSSAIVRVIRMRQGCVLTVYRGANTAVVDVPIVLLRLAVGHLPAEGMLPTHVEAKHTRDDLLRASYLWLLLAVASQS